MDVSFATRVAGRSAGETRPELQQAVFNSPTLGREDQPAILPMPLKQDTEVFSAYGILLSGAAADVVVFMHLTIHVLWKEVSKDVVYHRPGNEISRTRLTCSLVKQSMGCLARDGVGLTEPSPQSIDSFMRLLDRTVYPINPVFEVARAAF